jgi:hypothetical protein
MDRSCWSKFIASYQRRSDRADLECGLKLADSKIADGINPMEDPTLLHGNSAAREEESCSNAKCLAFACGSKA